MSNRIIESSVPNSSRANCLAVSVLPTPVGPTNKNEPIGRPDLLKPIRFLRIERATLSTASS